MANRTAGQTERDMEEGSQRVSFGPTDTEKETLGKNTLLLEKIQRTLGGTHWGSPGLSEGGGPTEACGSKKKKGHRSEKKSCQVRRGRAPVNTTTVKKKKKKKKRKN